MGTSKGSRGNKATSPDGIDWSQTDHLENEATHSRKPLGHPRFEGHHPLPLELDLSAMNKAMAAQADLLEFAGDVP